MQGTKGSRRVFRTQKGWGKAWMRDFVVSMGRNGWISISKPLGSKLATLSNFGRLQGIRTDPGCLVPDSKLIRAREYCPQRTRGWCKFNKGGGRTGVWDLDRLVLFCKRCVPRGEVSVSKPWERSMLGQQHLKISKHRKMQKVKKTNKQAKKLGWKNGWASEITCCSYRGPRFGSQLPYCEY